MTRRGPQRTVDSSNALGRRQAIGALGGFGALGASSGRTTNRAGGGRRKPAFRQTAGGFPDGVIAGDPAPDGAVIWTRLTPTAAPADIGVTWEVLDAGSVVAGGTVSAVEADDYTVHVRVTGLDSNRWYEYRFLADGLTSPVGRLRTAPAPAEPVESLRFAFVSCQQRSSPYAAHKAMLDEDLDFFIHLGDYVYVSDGGTIALDDYRSVWHLFRTTPELRELHRRFPCVGMWDDGEFYNGVDRTGDAARLAAGRRAYFENMPVERPADDPERLYRAFGWGSLAHLPVIDVRMYRDPAVEATNNETPEGAVAAEAGRTTLGVTQREWLIDSVESSEAIWQIVASGYNVLPVRVVDADTPERRAAEPDLVLNAGDYFPNEAFDDYQWERRLLLNQLYERCVKNVVFVAGHTHVYLGGRLYPDYDDLASPLVAHEFVCGSLTADPPPEGVVHDILGTDVSREEAISILRSIEQAGLAANAHLDYINLADQGYAVVEVTPQELHVQFKVLDTFAENPTVRVAWEYTVPVGATPSVCAAVAPNPTTSSTTTAPRGTAPTTPTTTPSAKAAPASPVVAPPRFTG